MLYHIHEFKSAAMMPTHMISEAASTFLGAIPESDDLYTRFLTASNELIIRGTQEYGKPEFGIEKVLRNNKNLNISEEDVIVKPFCNIKRFNRKAKTRADQKELNNDPVVLIAAPYSGHFATLLRDTARAMIPHHQTYITDWHNARDVPSAEGDFNLEDYIEYLFDFIRTLYQLHDGRRIHIIAVCQPAVPVLITTSLLSMYKEPCIPASITLMGGPIDTRINPGKVDEFAREHPMEWFEENIISPVPSYYEGYGRQVCPGFVLLNGFMSLNFERHQEAAFKHFEHLVKGSDMPSVDAHRRFYDEYRSVLDIPGDYYLDSIYHAFQSHSLPKRKFEWRGDIADPFAITQTALLTVEGELDDISCPGQTYAAHNLCKNLPQSMKGHVFQAKVGHYGIFNGSRWRNFIQPAIAEFIREHGA